MADTTKIKDFVQDLIAGNTANAEVNAHEYFVAKMRDISGTTSTQTDSTVSDDVADESDDD